MLNKQQISEINELLDKSQNPLFLFDNDVDGLCSFLILQRKIGRGKGVPIRSFPDLNASYLRKIEELRADAVFILDKPKVSEEFIEGVAEKNLPIIWIDHHETELPKNIDKVHYYNSFPTSEPVTYLCYQLSKKDEWLAMIGCISDVFKPEFSEKFAEEHPELFDSKLSAFDALFSTEIGRVAKMLGFALKDTTTNVVQMMKYIFKADNIYDLLEENKFTKPMHTRYEQLKKGYDKTMEKAEEQLSSSKLLFFSYAGEMSMSSEIANGLYFKHKDKFIVVVYKKQDQANISIRGKNAKKITQKALEGIEGATGGGHEEATGARVPIDKLDEFKKNIENQL